jgi:uncharacterized protein YkwD
MYWGQVAASLAVALSALSWLLSEGYAFLTAAAVAVICYISIRWLISWGFRIRYWYGHDGYKRTRCGGCGKSIYRLRGDWVLTCHRCGWTAGWRGVRWFTHSVPVVQLKRTVAGPRLVVVVVAALLVTSGATAQLATLDYPIAADEDQSDAGVQAGQQTPVDVGMIETPSPEPTDAGDAAGSDTRHTAGINVTRTEALLLDEINHYREEENVWTVSRNDRSSTDAREYAAELAERGYLSHVSRSGEPPSERYHCTNGENLAQTWVHQNVLMDDGVETYSSAPELAEGLAQQWMNSPPHRENMLSARWDTAGVGIVITEDNEVYAALVMC